MYRRYDRGFFFAKSAVKFSIVVLCMSDFQWMMKFSISIESSGMLVVFWPKTNSLIARAQSLFKNSRQSLWRNRNVCDPAIIMHPPVGISVAWWLYALCRNSKFKKHDGFIGYQQDTPASVIFQATNLLRLACAAAKEGDLIKKGKWADIFKWSQMKPEDSCYGIEGTEQQSLWENAVSAIPF